MQGVTFSYCYAECHYAECRYGECHYGECHYGECHYGECHYGECCYGECRYTDPCTFFIELILKHNYYCNIKKRISRIVKSIGGKYYKSFVDLSFKS